MENAVVIYWRSLYCSRAFFIANSGRKRKKSEFDISVIKKNHYLYKYLFCNTGYLSVWFGNILSIAAGQTA